MTNDSTAGSALSRRALLTGGAGVAVGSAATLAVQRAMANPTTSAQPTAPAEPETYPFHGEHQSGIATPGQQYALLTACDLLPGLTREALIRLMRIWTDDSERLMRAEPGLTDQEMEMATVPARLTITVGLGPRFFDVAERTAQRPVWCTPLPSFKVDRLEPRWSGGDLILQVCADDETVAAHARRILLRGARTFLTTRWFQRGFRGITGPAGMRNMMGQWDGTVNPSGPDAHDSVVWHGPNAAAWLRGGTSMVVRRIAMNLDTWEELDRDAREKVIGRTLNSGAPLTGNNPHDIADLAATDKYGRPIIANFAHVRRARATNPREKFLRRPFNYNDAPEGGGASNSGLVFITFQQDPVEQFVPVQRRLDELDLLNTWTTPIGSAVFAVPRGCQPGEYLAQDLLA